MYKQCIKNRSGSRHTFRDNWVDHGGARQTLSCCTIPGVEHPHVCDAWPPRLLRNYRGGCQVVGAETTGTQVRRSLPDARRGYPGVAAEALRGRSPKQQRGWRRETGKRAELKSNDNTSRNGVQRQGRESEGTTKGERKGRRGTSWSVSW